MLSIFQTQIFKVNFVGSKHIWVIDVAISLYTLPTLIIKKENLTKLLSTTSIKSALRAMRPIRPELIPVSVALSD